MYKAVNAVNANTALMETDLTAITRGGLNAIRTEFNNHATTACTGVHSHVNVKKNVIIEQRINI